MEPRKEEPKPKRFRIVKLEDRVVPSHLPHVAEVVVGSPAIEHAPAQKLLHEQRRLLLREARGAADVFHDLSDLLGVHFASST